MYILEYTNELFYKIKFYEVVYGSPCGRPEKVCLFILP